MTVGDVPVSETRHLPEQVTQVKKETIKAFPHSKRVGGYLLGQTLGVGSFAKVKESLHLTTGERVAVKIIDKKRAKTDNYVRKNLRREGKLLQLIRHPNVVTLLEVMETDNSYYLVTEICRGGDLMEYISAKKRLPEAEVSKFIRQIVSAVDYLHRMGIIHRDLKIENLLLDENKNIKLIDFGLSNFIKVADSPEGTQAQEFCVTQCGSPAYAAPELLNHEKYGLQVDLWSIGVNMYAMLTGGLPFTVEPFNIKALYSKMRDRQMNPLPEGLSKDCKDLLHRFLTPDPAKRVTISEALSHPWLIQGNKPVPRHPCPNRMRASDLDADILSHMSDNLNFRMAEVIKFVTFNTPSPACATYHLYNEKLRRYNAEMRSKGLVPFTGSSKSKIEDNRIILHLQDICNDADKEKAPNCDLATSKMQAAVVEVTDTSGTTSSTNNIKDETSMGIVRPNDDENTVKKDVRNTYARYDMIKINNADLCDTPTSDASKMKASRPSSCVFRPLPLKSEKEFFTKGKSAFEVVTPRVIDPLDFGKNLTEKQTKNKFITERNETEHLKDKFNFAYAQSQSKNVVTPLKIQILPSRHVKNETTSEPNWNKTSEEVVINSKNKLNTGHNEQNQDTIMKDTNSNNQESSQSSQSRRYIQNNRLLSRRGVIKTIDMNASIIPDEKRQIPSVHGGNENLRIVSHPSPTLSKIVPKQFKPFRSAQDRPRLSENCPPHYLKQHQKTKTSESMTLRGKNLLNTAYSEDFNSPKGVMSPPPKPAVVRRKLAKRHRLNDLAAPDVTQDIDQMTTTDLLISDVIELKSMGGKCSGITSSLPSISPANLSR